MATPFADIDAIFMQAILNAGFGWPVANENVNYEPQDGQPFLAAYVLPSPVVQASLGDFGCDNHSGFFQIDVNVPKDQGKTSALEMADQINAVFKSGAVFTDGTTRLNIRNVSIANLTVAGGWATLPMTVEFFTYISRA